MKNILGKSLVLLLTLVTIFFLTPSSLMAGKPTKNITPIADAGSDQNEYVGELVTLYGSGSYDADDGPEALTYLWQIKKAPKGSTATLSDTTVVSPTFTPDIVGTYQMNLIVNDGIKKSRADTMYVTVTEAPPNTPPVAHAGTDQNVDTLSLVTLDGSDSSDADAGDTLSYSWTIQSVPAGSSVTALTNPLTVNPTFRADVDGSYVLQLIVNDGIVNSVPDTVTIISSTAVENATILMSVPLNAYSGISTLLSVYVDGVEHDIADIELIDSVGNPIVLETSYDPLTNKGSSVIPSGILAGLYDIRIRTGSGYESTMADTLNIAETLSLTIDSVGPADVSTLENTEVSITVSSGLVGTPDVYLTTASGSTVAVRLKGVVVIDANTIQAIVPMGLATGSYNLVVVDNIGEPGVLIDALNVYSNNAEIDSISPSSVLSSATTDITVSCDNFDCTNASVFLLCSSGENQSLVTQSSSVTEVVFNLPAGSITGDQLCTVDVSTVTGRNVHYNYLFVESYSSNSMWVQSSGNMQDTRNHPALSIGKSGDDNFLYAIGGDNFSSGLFSSIEHTRLDQFGNISGWSYLQNSLPESITNASAVTVGNFIYLAGGNNGTSVSNKLYRAHILQPENIPEVESFDPSLSTGSGLSSGQWHYRIAALFPSTNSNNPSGESLAGQIFSVDIPASADSLDITLSWNAISDASGYRIYRTPVSSLAASLGMELLSEVSGTSYTDSGMTTNPSMLPLKKGALGKWHSVGNGLITARESSGFTAVQKPSSSTEFLLYGVGGADENALDLASYEYATVTVGTNGTQTVSTFSMGSSTLSKARHGLDVVAATSENTAIIPSGESWLYMGSGTGVNIFEAAQIGSSGELSSISETNTVGALSDYALYKVNESLVINTGSSASEASIQCSSGTCSLGVWNNSGNGFNTVRYAPGKTQDGHFLYTAGGNNGTSALSSVEMSYK